ncbi:MAG TPA: RDD family protein [Actinophytocola sp.]|nr:RDD family protein [Actinophytocola sp.]
MARPSAADLLLGVGAAGVGLVRWSFRLTTRAVGTVYPPAGRFAATAAERARADVDLLLRQVIARVLGVALDSVDLTKLVRENVDLDAVAEDLDVAAVVERIDLDQVLARVDIAAIAHQVIEEIDLPEIVRESSGALASEAVGAVRARAIRAEDALPRVLGGGPGPAADRPGRVPTAAAHHRPAGIVTRLLGAAIDTGTVALLTLLLYLGVAGLRFMWWPASFRWPHPHVLLSVAAVIVVAVGYLATGWVTSGRSVGGSVLGFRVLSHDRSLLGWPRAGARAALYVVFPLGLALAAVGPSRRSLQDILLRSTVVYDWHHDGGARASRTAP